MGKRTTLVFDFDIKSMKTNPLFAQTPFGQPVIVNDGDLAADNDRLHEQLAAAEAQRDELRHRLSDMVEDGDKTDRAAAIAALSLTPEAALEERRAVEEVVEALRLCKRECEIWQTNDGATYVGEADDLVRCLVERADKALARLDGEKKDG